MNLSLPAAKAALHRGRARLRELANEPHDAWQPVMAPADHVRLASYIERFNAREFDALMARFVAVDAAEPIERIRQLCHCYVDHAIDNPELFRAMFVYPPELANTSATGQELPAATKAFEMAFESGFGIALRNHQHEGVMRLHVFETDAPDQAPA